MTAARRAKKRRSQKVPIHHSIKQRLGYAVDEPDTEILKDWKTRLSRVCKPCWELKYCPYGPLVEQSPLLPPERKGSVEHNEYKRKCLETGLIGQVSEIDDDTRNLYEACLQDEDVLIRQVLHELDQEERQRKAEASDDPAAAFLSEFAGPLPPIQEYRATFEHKQKRIDLSRLSKAALNRVRKRVKERKRKLQAALDSGIYDGRHPIDVARRVIFQMEVAQFDPNALPETIPQIFQDGQCNIFGHICPVFFAAEAITETNTKRRRGRYIPFTTKIRVVRRDNYTCQHCGVHLRDDEVEFDHRIPISRGGSSEEHNVRLTCFDCNRDKSDQIEIQSIAGFESHGCSGQARA